MKKNLAQAHRQLAGRHELPDGHDIRVGPGTIQVSAHTSTGWQWFDVAANAAACDALSIYALNADIVDPKTYELPDGHDIRVGPDMVQVQVRGSRPSDVELKGKWIAVATTDEACEILADLAREAAKLREAEDPEEDETEWEMVGADGRTLDDSVTFVASTEDEARDMARRTGKLPRTPVRFVHKKQRQGDGLAEGAVGAALGAAGTYRCWVVTKKKPREVKVWHAPLKKDAIREVTAAVREHKSEGGVESQDERKPYETTWAWVRGKLIKTEF